MLTFKIHPSTKCESLESTYTNTQKKGKMEIKQGFTHSPLENGHLILGQPKMERWTPKRNGGSSGAPYNRLTVS